MHEVVAHRLWDFSATVLIVLAVVLAVAGIGLFTTMSAAEKRRWGPRAAVCVGVLSSILMSSLALFGPRHRRSLVAPFLVVPAIALSTYFGVKEMKYCDRCDELQPPGPWSDSQRFCPYCGAELNGKPPRDERMLD